MSKKTKRYLMLLVAVGLIAVAAGGSGTFASFTAETANTGNYFATGTLFLHNNGGTTTCTSESVANNANIIDPTGCDILFAESSLTPGTLYTANLTLSNAGTLDASGIKFALGSNGCVEAKPTIATNGVALTSGVAPTTLTLTDLDQDLLDGTEIELHENNNANTQIYKVSGDYSAGASVVVTLAAPANANFSYTTAATVSLAAFGTGTLCSNLQVYVQEKNSAFNTDLKCVYGLALNATTCDPAPTGFSLTDVGTSVNANPLALKSGGSGNTLLQLDAKKSRYFVIGILAPASLSNANQNNQVAFDLKWHIDQA
jgi:predicted ribosomally synthesized peptide with SipW-like signal peptide